MQIHHPSRPWTQVALLALAVLGSSCSRSEPPPVPVDPPPAEDPGRSPTFEEMLGFEPEETEPPDRGEGLPVLAFRPSSQGLPEAGTWREEPLLHDFTGDGRADIVASNRQEDGLSTWQSREDGTWQLRIDGLRRDLMYGGSAAADFDGDGIDDLLFAAHKLGLILYLNDGSMGWTEGPEIESPMLMLDVASGDLNGDGLPDAVGIGQFGGGIEVYLGDGQGNLRHLPESETLEWINFGMTVELADVDGDGLDDILAATRHGAKVLITRITEEGTLYWEDRSEGLPAPPEGNTMRSVVAADVLGDGRMEIVTCRIGLPAPGANHFGVHRWDEEGATWVQIDRGVPREPPYTEALPADFNNDGHVDLLLATSYGLVTIYLGDGTGGFELAGKLPDVQGTRHRAALGDVDGDGWIDVLLLWGSSKQDRRGGGLAVYINGPDVWTEH